MQSSNAPSKIQLPFAASGTKNAIPIPSQQGIKPGAASFTDGFPPLTFTPKNAGGIPPAGGDINGVLNAITALQQWKSAGGQFPFDATFATAIGGYPKGATVLKADGTGLWISTAENNTANPDTGGAGWLAFSASSVQSGSYNSAPDTGVANAYAMTLSPTPTALTRGMTVILQNIIASNTGASTLNVNGSGALQIFGIAGAALQGGELVASGDAQLMLNNSGTAWILVKSPGAFPVSPGIQSNQAVNLSQFSSSNGAVGYQKFPGGLIIQWSNSSPTYVTANTQVTIDVNWPIAFPVGVASLGILGFVPTVTNVNCFLSLNGATKTSAAVAFYSNTAQQITVSLLGLGY